MRSRVGLMLILLWVGPVVADLLGLKSSDLEWARARWGNTAVSRLQQWDQLTESLRTKNEREQVEAVNRFVDTIPYISDQEHWHQEDYWATPLEMIGSNGGDCEDYAIAKYFTLRSLGVPASRLRITYVEALQINQAHMVLAYYPQPGQEPLILDSLVNRILPASQRPDLVPVYSFNSEGMWVSGGQAGDGAPVNDGSGLDKWQDVLRRIQGQPGFRGYVNSRAATGP